MGPYDWLLILFVSELPKTHDKQKNLIGYVFGWRKPLFELCSERHSSNICILCIVPEGIILDLRFLENAKVFFIYTFVLGLHLAMIKT